MDISQILMGYIIPALAIALSVAFWLNGRASARDAKRALDEITETTRGWQKEIMESAINMLGARTEVVGKQIVLEEAKAKTEVLQKVTEAIQAASVEIAKNPKAGEESKTQLRTLELLLGTLLEHIGRAKDKQQLAQAMIEGKQNQNDS